MGDEKGGAFILNLDKPKAEASGSQTREQRMASLGMITPKLAKKPRLPEVKIATCCEGDDYLCASINGLWHEVFIVKISEDTKRKIATFTVKSRPASVCRICRSPLDTAKTRLYHFGDRAELDDNFTETAMNMMNVAQGKEALNEEAQSEPSAKADK